MIRTCNRAGDDVVAWIDLASACRWRYTFSQRLRVLKVLHAQAFR
jgi:hypothetical protein